MIFRRARFQNFRLLRDLDIEFACDLTRPLSVVRAENETGKTTLLTGLQWVLFGADAIQSRISEYRMFPVDVPAGRVVVEGQIEFDHDFERRLETGDWLKETEQFLAHRRCEIQVNEEDSWTMAGEKFQLFRRTEGGFQPLAAGGMLELRQMLGSSVRDLFFTDGDRALSFISSELTVGDKRKLVQQAVRDMLGFEILERAAARLEKANTIMRSKSRELPGGRELGQYVQQIEELEALIQEDRRHLAEVEQGLKNIATSIATLEAKREKALEKGDREQLARELRTHTEALQAFRSDQRRSADEHGSLFCERRLALEMLCDDLILAAGKLNALKEQGKIPRTAIPVLQERLELGVCICGAALSMGGEGYKHIKDLIEHQKQASDTDDRLTSLRLVASGRVVELEDEVPKWLTKARAIVGARNQLSKHISHEEAEVKRIERQIDELSDTDIGELNSQLKSLRQTKEKLIKEQGIAEHRTVQREGELDHAKEKYDSLLKRQGEAQRLRNQLSASQDLLSVMKGSYSEIEEREIPEVSRAMNHYFLEMIEADPENAIIRRAEVTPEYDIAVYGPDNRRLDPDRDLNGASRRALTLSFILALTEVSGVHAPNVIDTPLGMMSHLVKRAVLSTTVRHSRQLVLFLTRSEIKDCEDLIDRYAGNVTTLSNSAHFPRMLVNQPDSDGITVLHCNCNHRQYCDVCERRTDSEEGYLVKRA